MKEKSLAAKLMYDMLYVRLVEEAIAERYAEQEMRCPVHLCIGQEAVAAGVSAHLGNADRVMSGHRSHGHYLAKGGNLGKMLAEIYGRASGCCGGRGGSMHLIDLDAGFWGATPIVASTIPIATGLAFAAQMRGDDCVTVIYFGEGATEEGTFHEAVHFAALKNLPILFVCENNLYSVYSPMSVRQPNREVFSLAKGHGIPSMQGDGNDVLEVYEMFGNAVQRTRAGHGPAFLEFKTYRWREHCGPNFDNDIGYRTEDEYLEWRKRCPIERFQARCLADASISEQEFQSMQTRIQAEITAAFKFAQSSPWPDQATVRQGVFADTNPRMIDESTNGRAA